MNWNSRIRALIAVAVLVHASAPRSVAAADISVTVIDLEAKGVDSTVADLATDDLATSIGDEGIAVVTSEALKAELKRRGISQTCGVDDCPVAFDKIVKSTHLLRGSLFEIKGRRILKVTVDTVSPRKQIFSGRREFDASDASTTAAVRGMAAGIITCLKGGSCKDMQPVQVASVQAAPVAITAPASAPASIPPAVPVAAEMIPIPAGNFMYGKDKKTIDLPVYRIDKTEVTVAAYAKCVQADKCSPPDAGEDCNWGKRDRSDHPVNCVNSRDAMAYCEWTGKRLPTEQEWEKAARGTDGRIFPWGEQEPACDRVIMSQGSSGCGKSGTWPVCSKPNGNSPYGLCDLAGNVWEWTADWYDNTQKWRALRGGSWDLSKSANFRTTVRGNYFSDPSLRASGFGFRCAQ